MKGTIKDDAVAMRFTPPKIISATSKVTTTAVIIIGILKVSCIAWVIAFT